MQNNSLLIFLRSNITLFLFIGLTFLSVAFFVRAESGSSTQTIFADADQDNLSNEEESLYGTDPSNKDSDGDGYSDGVEIESGYDPLKPAPGDRIVSEALATPVSSDEPSSQPNLTAEVSTQIAGVLKNAGEGNQDITLEQVNAAVQEVLSGNVEEVVLPEVDLKAIKIKRAPSKDLKDKEREERERQDVLEYLTAMSYIIANNSPSNFESQDEFGSLMGSLSDQSVQALASGNLEYIEALSEKGTNILEESKDIEVPEAMLEVHVKALKMALYAQSLKGELRPHTEDPLGQIAVLSKVQGLLSVVADFTNEVYGALERYEIEEIPLEI